MFNLLQERGLFIMQKYYTIYKLTNKVTKKSYVGQTTNTVERRFTFHKSSAKRGSKTPLHEAISKYGAENFVLEIIDENIPEGSADDCERFWIKKLKTRFPDGYNLQGGGKSAYGTYSSRYGYSSHGEIVMCDKKTENISQAQNIYTDRPADCQVKGRCSQRSVRKGACRYAGASVAYFA